MQSAVQAISCLRPCTSNQKAGVQVLFEDHQPPCRVANATPAAVEVGLFLPARDKLGELQLGKPLHILVVRADTDAELAADQPAAEGKFKTPRSSQTERQSCHAPTSWQACMDGSQPRPHKPLTCHQGIYCQAQHASCAICHLCMAC